MLDHGRVVETGTYDELVALGGRFAALAARDFDSFDASEVELTSSPSSSNGQGRAQQGSFLPVFESVQEWEVATQVELSRLVQRPLDLEEDVLAVLRGADVDRAVDDVAARRQDAGHLAHGRCPAGSSSPTS